MHDPNQPLPKEKQYSSRTKEGKCKNLLCNSSRRNGSAYCQGCADNKKIMRKIVAQRIKLMIEKESLKRRVEFRKIFYRRAKRMYTALIPWTKRYDFTLRDLP